MYAHLTYVNTKLLKCFTDVNTNVCKYTHTYVDTKMEQYSKRFCNNSWLEDELRHN